MKNENFVVLTGAMGGGKSTILKTLFQMATVCVPEPARKILFEQRSIGASGVPEIDSGLFTMLMLSRSIHDYNEHEAGQMQVVFDRGIPDMIAYAELFGLDLRPYKNAAEQYRYNDTVFYFPPWEDIYSTDEERKMSFEAAKAFGVRTIQIYRDLGHTVIEMPFVSIDERVRFVLEKLKELRTS